MNTMIFIDISVIINLWVLYYLSKKLGEALKTPPYHIIFLISNIFFIVEIIFNVLILEIPGYDSEVITLTILTMRVLFAAVSVFATLIYWKWLFNEFFR